MTSYILRDEDIYKEGEEDKEYTFLQGLAKLNEINKTEPIICRYGLLKMTEIYQGAFSFESHCTDANFFAITTTGAGIYYFYNLKKYIENGHDELRLKINGNNRKLELVDIIGHYYSKRIENPRYESEYKILTEKEIEAVKAKYNDPPKTKKAQSEYKKQMNAEIKEIKHKPVPDEYKDTYIPTIYEPTYKIIDILKILSYWNCKQFNLFTKEQCEEKYYEVLRNCQQDFWTWNNKGFF